MKTLGFSTGCVYRYFGNKENISKESVGLIRSTGCDAIELCALFEERLDTLDNLSKEELSDFKQVSLHVPDLDIFYKKNDAKTKRVLEKLEKYQKKFNFKWLVLCPNYVQDWEVIKEVSVPWALENMDKRKGAFTSVEDMQKIFSETDFKMVLDLTHAYTVDKSMKLAKELYEKFADLICEVHLSGYQVQDEDEQQHFPIHISNQREILQAVPTKEVPVIIESVLPEEEILRKLSQKERNQELAKRLQKEYNFVRNYLDSKN